MNWQVHSIRVRRQDGSRRALASDGMGSGYRIYLRSMSSLQANGM